jgi:ABC-type protease/lipase transport system fused ATPase/permease subunit
LLIWDAAAQPLFSGTDRIIMQNKFSASSELAAALWSLRRIFFIAGGFSFFINMIMLVPAIYMLQIYDRVLSSRSESTLLMLT